MNKLIVLAGLLLLPVSCTKTTEAPEKIQLLSNLQGGGDDSWDCFNKFFDSSLTMPPLTQNLHSYYDCIAKNPYSIPNQKAPDIRNGEPVPPPTGFTDFDNVFLIAGMDKDYALYEDPNAPPANPFNLLDDANPQIRMLKIVLSRYIIEINDALNTIGYANALAAPGGQWHVNLPAVMGVINSDPDLDADDKAFIQKFMEIVYATNLLRQTTPIDIWSRLKLDQLQFPQPGGFYYIY